MEDLNSNPLMTNSVQPEFLIYITHNPSEAPEAQKLHAPSAKALAGFFLFLLFFVFFKSSSQLLGHPHIALPYQFPLTLLSASE